MPPVRACRSIVALLALSSAGACVEVVGIEPMKRDACSTPLESTDCCASCMRGGCCHVMSDCALDPKCRAANECLAACDVDQPACRHDCLVSHADAKKSGAFAAVDSCRHESCLEDCVGLGGWEEFHEPSEACTTCIERCEPLAPQCVGNPECDDVLACMSACRDTACTFRCRGVIGDQLFASIAGSFENCLLGCASDCGYANDFGCVGKYSWFGTDESTDVSWAFKFVDPSTQGGPLTGIHVRLCSIQDCTTCLEISTPHEATSDEDGLAIVSVPYGFEGCFSIDGGPDFTKILLYPGIPMTVDLPPNPIPMRAGTPQFFAQLAGLEQTPGRGMLNILQVDCRVAANVVATFESTNADEETSDFAFSNNSGLTFSTGIDEGDQAFVFNHPTGLTVVKSFVDGLGQVGETEADVLPDTISAVIIAPRYVE